MIIFKNLIVIKSKLLKSSGDVRSLIFNYSIFFVAFRSAQF